MLLITECDIHKIRSLKQSEEVDRSGSFLPTDSIPQEPIENMRNEERANYFQNKHFLSIRFKDMLKRARDNLPQVRVEL